MHDEEARTPGPGWWIASDGALYPPEEHPDTRALREQPGAAEEPSVDDIGPHTTATTARQAVDATVSGARRLGSHPPVGTGSAVDPPSDDFGGSLHRASGAFRDNVAMLAAVSLVVLLVGAAGLLVVGLIEVGAASLGWASLSVAVSLLTRLAQLCILAWMALVMVRTWKLAAGDEPLELGQLIMLGGFLPFLCTFILVGPIIVLTGGAAWGFAVIALLLTAGARMSPAAAIGRMLGDTCGSARRFFQTLLMGVLFGMFSWTILLLSSAVFAQVTTGAAMSTISNGFADVSTVRETDTNLTVLAGTGLAAVLAIGLGLLLWNGFGLWVACYTRRLTTPETGTTGG